MEVTPSHPAWVCGLKHSIRGFPPAFGFVTPCVGVWIETHRRGQPSHLTAVTPCVGVWIETQQKVGTDYGHGVTPCVGVWIETLFRRI